MVKRSTQWKVNWIKTIIMLLRRYNFEHRIMSEKNLFGKVTNLDVLCLNLYMDSMWKVSFVQRTACNITQIWFNLIWKVLWNCTL